MHFIVSVKLKSGDNLYISFISVSSAKLCKTIFCSSLLYISHAIIVNLDKRASDNFISSPGLQVAIILKCALKFLNSLFSSVVKVS